MHTCMLEQQCSLSISPAEQMMKLNTGTLTQVCVTCLSIPVSCFLLLSVLLKGFNSTDSDMRKAEL